MTPQELIGLPHHGDAQNQVILQKQWDYDYPSWFIERGSEITGIELTEMQRDSLRDVYEGVLEGSP